MNKLWRYKCANEASSGALDFSEMQVTPPMAKTRIPPLPRYLQLQGVLRPEHGWLDFVEVKTRRVGSGKLFKTTVGMECQAAMAPLADRMNGIETR